MATLRSFLNDLSLFKTLAIGLIVGLTAPIGIATWIQLKEQHTILLQQINADRAQVLAVLALSVQIPLWENQPETAIPLLKALMSDEQITRITVSSPLMMQPLEVKSSRYDPHYSLFETQAVFYKDKQIGRIRVAMDTRWLTSQLTTQLIYSMVTGLLELTIGILILFILIRYKILTPLKDLVKSTEVLATGNLVQSLLWHRHDEIGVLGESFEKMRAALVKRVAHLELNNETLRTHEMELAGQASVFRAILDNMTDGITLVDEKLRLVAWNNRFTHMIDGLREITRPGVSIKELFAHQLAHGKNSQDKHIVVEDFLASFRQGKTHTVRYRLADGRRLDIRQQPMPNGGFVSTYTDITEEVEARRKAEEIRLLLEAVMDAAPALLHVKDRNLRYQFVNQRFLTWWRLRREDVLGKTNAQVFIKETGTDRKLARFENVEELLERSQRRDKKLLETGKSLPFTEIVYKTGKPEPTTLWSTKVPLVGSDRRVTHIVSVSLDISERKRAEAELAHHREALHQSEKLSALGSLLAGVAHELNNPLSVVVGRSIMLEEQLQDPKTTSSIKKIRVAAERCSRIVKMFLAMARQQESVQTPVQLYQVIKTSLDMVAYRLHESQVEVNVSVETELPEVWADADQLIQVFTNLFLNAQQAMATSPKPRRLTVSAQSSSAEKTVCIQVADNGPGISLDIRSRIFEPFFTTKAIGEGTGVGLSVSYGIIEAHGGRLSVASPDRGNGSVFKVTLPLFSVPKAMQNTQAPIVKAAFSRRVLIIDDVVEISQLLSEILRMDGHYTETVGNGRAALRQLSKQSFDVIISDLRMPDLDGPGLYQELQIRYPECLNRLIFITGDTLSEGVKHFLAQAQRPVIEKPFVPDEIRRLVRQVLNLCQM
jgi:C4-dicarboxylate-specific signal transduction histidine kinase/CheY-like chemotaxis protein